MPVQSSSSGSSCSSADEMEDREDDGTIIYYKCSETRVPPVVRRVLNRKGWREWNKDIDAEDRWSLHWKSGRFKLSDWDRYLLRLPYALSGSDVLLLHASSTPNACPELIWRMLPGARRTSASTTARKAQRSPRRTTCTATSGILPFPIILCCSVYCAHRQIARRARVMVQMLRNSYGERSAESESETRNTKASVRRGRAGGWQGRTGRSTTLCRRRLCSRTSTSASCASTRSRPRRTSGSASPGPRRKELPCCRKRLRCCRK